MPLDSSETVKTGPLFRFSGRLFFSELILRKETYIGNLGKFLRRTVAARILEFGRVLRLFLRRVAAARIPEFGPVELTLASELTFTGNRLSLRIGTRPGGFQVISRRLSTCLANTYLSANFTTRCLGASSRDVRSRRRYDYRRLWLAGDS